jgi:virginiamycin B lyase
VARKLDSLARVRDPLACTALGACAVLLALGCTAPKSADDRPPPSDAAVDAGPDAPGDAGGAACPTITEFSLSGDAGKFPAGIVEGPDGNLWFTLEYTAGFVPGGAGRYGDGLGWMSPDGSSHEIAVHTPGAGPSAITLGPDHNPWFTEFGSGNVGRVIIDGGPIVTELPTPASAPNGISPGPDGQVWFTDLDGNNVDRVSVDGGTVTPFPIPQASSQPRGIVLGPDGNLWFGEQAGLVGRVTSKGQFDQFAVPMGNPSVGSITVGPDGNLWFTDGGNEAIGRITTAGVITEYAIPTPGSNPFDIVAGPDGALWFTETSSNKIGRLAAGTDGAVSFLECDVPTQRSNPLAITATSSAVWFTEAYANKIGRVALP